MSGELVSRAQHEAGVYVDPAVGPTDQSGADQPFSARDLARIDEALTLATRETGVLFSVYVGQLAEPTRESAEALIGELDDPDAGTVLLAVSPGQRVLQIVTTQKASRRLPNRTCALAALAMRAAFAGGDLAAGVVSGLRMLADAAGTEQRTGGR